MSLCVSLSLPTSNVRPAIPGTVKSHLCFFYRSPSDFRKEPRRSSLLPTFSSLHGLKHQQEPDSLRAPPLALAIVTRNVPLAMLPDSSGRWVQAKVSQGHVRPPSVLVPLSPFLHSLQVNEGWEGFALRAGLQPSSRAASQASPDIPFLAAGPGATAALSAARKGTLGKEQPPKRPTQAAALPGALQIHILTLLP